MPMVSRRAFLLGALGTAVLASTGSYIAIEDDVLPGRIRLAELVGTCDVDAPPPSGSVGTIKTGTFMSAARHRDVGWSLALPPGRTSAADLPVVLVLHGRGGDHTTGFEQLGLHRFLAAHTQAGGVPFALAAVDGGDGYWHPRANGDDPLRMLGTEFVPMLATLDCARPASECSGGRWVAMARCSLPGKHIATLCTVSRLPLPQLAVRRCSGHSDIVRTGHSTTPPTSPHTEPWLTSPTLARRRSMSRAAPMMPSRPRPSVIEPTCCRRQQVASVEAVTRMAIGVHSSRIRSRSSRRILADGALKAQLFERVRDRHDEVEEQRHFGVHEGQPDRERVHRRSERETWQGCAR